MMSRGLVMIFCGALVAGIPTLVASPFDAKAAVLTWIGLLISVVGGVVQERDGKPYVLDFNPSDWSRSDDGYFLDIPRKAHGKGNAGIAEIYTLAENGRYHVCMCSVGRDSSGDCRVEISDSPFTGRVLIQ